MTFISRLLSQTKNNDTDKIYGLITGYVHAKQFGLQVEDVKITLDNNCVDITIFVDIPARLIGPGGRYSRELAGFLSRELDKVVRLKIK